MKSKRKEWDEMKGEKGREGRKKTETNYKKRWPINSDASHDVTKSENNEIEVTRDKSQLLRGNSAIVYFAALPILSLTR